MQGLRARRRLGLIVKPGLESHGTVSESAGLPFPQTLELVSPLARVRGVEKVVDLIPKALSNFAPPRSGPIHAVIRRWGIGKSSTSA
jgi:hypothetical protein